MALRFPDDEKREAAKQTSQFIENTVNDEVQQPVIFPLDATKAESIQQLGIIFNALGVGMTKEFAETHNLEHMLVPIDEDKV